jgi:rRNA processing protein Krr1/Pno1
VGWHACGCGAHGQEETGARFDIDPVAKALTISGAKEQVAKAAALVRQTLVSNSCELDVAVQEADVGAVVGKGGVTIKQIQAESGASLEIQRGFAGSLSIVKLIGTAQQVAAAKQLVEKCVSREPELKAGEVCETLELGGAVGLVIGSAGAAVKQLQEETGAKVDILRGCGTCKVFGAPEAVAVAKAKIEEKMAAHADREAKAAAAAEAAAANGGWEAAAAPPGAEDWSAATDGSGSHWTPADAPVVGGPPPMGSWGSAPVPAAPAGWEAAATGAPPGFFGAGSAANPEPW